MDNNIAPNVTVIAPTRNLQSVPLVDVPKRKRVAAYARVSTDEDDQMNSFNTQVQYFTRLIQSNPGWDLVKIYADPGISGLSTKNRKEFLQMVEDARQGKIDIIYCKDTSRFSRNTLDIVGTIRELKSLGVRFIFENQGIDTNDPGYEFLLTVHASMNQHESEAMAARIRWANEVNFKAGKVSMPYKSFLGYRQGPNKKPEIDPEQAKTVKLIYKLFLEGYTFTEIAKTLESKNILSPRGNKKWRSSTIKSILTNEKYIGDARFQKTYSNGPMDKTPHKNNGERPQYYAENSHPAIIDKTTYAMVQDRINNCGNKRGTVCHSPFNHKLFCEDCGTLLGHKTWKCRDTHTYNMWVCNNKSNTSKRESGRCKTPNLREETIKDAYLSAIAEILPLEAEISRNNANLLAFNSDPDKEKKYAKKLQKLEQACEQVTNDIQEFVKKPSSLFADANAYNIELNRLAKEDKDAITAYQEFKDDYANKTIKASRISKFINAIHQQSLSPSTFNPDIFIDAVDKVLVGRNYLKFIFMDGRKIKISL